MTVWKLEGYNTDSRHNDVRYRAYTTSQKKAELFKKIPKIRFTDSGHGIVFSAFEAKGPRLPTISTLADYVSEEMAKLAPKPVPKQSRAALLEELSRLKAETPDNGDRSGHDLPEALREFMADRGRLLAYGDADLIREAIAQLSRLKAGEQPTDKEADLRALGVAPAAPRERETLTEQELYYLRSIKRSLDEWYSLAPRGGLGGEVLADNRDWLDCFIDQHTRALAPSTSGGK